MLPLRLLTSLQLLHAAPGYILQMSGPRAVVGLLCVSSTPNGNHTWLPCSFRAHPTHGLAGASQLPPAGWQLPTHLRLCCRWRLTLKWLQHRWSAQRSFSMERSCLGSPGSAADPGWWWCCQGKGRGGCVCCRARALQAFVLPLRIAAVATAHCAVPCCKCELFGDDGGGCCSIMIGTNDGCLVMVGSS